MVKYYIVKKSKRGSGKLKNKQRKRRKKRVQKGGILKYLRLDLLKDNRDEKWKANAGKRINGAEIKKRHPKFYDFMWKNSGLWTSNETFQKRLNNPKNKRFKQLHDYYGDSWHFDYKRGSDW